MSEEIREGWVSAELREEFPRLVLCELTVEGSAGRSGRSTRARLAHMSDRFTGGKAVTLRLEPVPSAYRTFFRQVGIDPDQRRTPVEEVSIRRIQEGTYRSRGRVEDAVTIAVVETGVPILAFDADRLGGPLGLRLSGRAEQLGADGRSLPAGALVVSDPERPVAVLFVDRSEDTVVSRDTSRVALAAVGVAGVPRISVEESLWIAGEVLSEAS